MEGRAGGTADCVRRQVGPKARRLQAGQRGGKAGGGEEPGMRKSGEGEYRSERKQGPRERESAHAVEADEAAIGQYGVLPSSVRTRIRLAVQATSDGAGRVVVNPDARWFAASRKLPS